MNRRSDQYKRNQVTWTTPIYNMPMCNNPRYPLFIRPHHMGSFPDTELHSTVYVYVSTIYILDDVMIAASTIETSLTLPGKKFHQRDCRHCHCIFLLLTVFDLIWLIFSDWIWPSFSDLIQFPLHAFYFRFESQHTSTILFTPQGFPYRIESPENNSKVK